MESNHPNSHPVSNEPTDSEINEGNIVLVNCITAEFTADVLPNGVIIT